MATTSCGIDFGTSNSSVAVARNGHISLVPVEGDHLTTPSAIFFQRKGNLPFYGRKAVDLFFDRQDGRFMRSLKRVLGTSLMKQGTAVNGKPMRFERIIAPFLKNLKDKTDVYCGEEVEHVVMGRPVHFIDNDPDADRQAQLELKTIAEQVGFKHIEFQFEPIAAAFAHEINIRGEKLAIVVDLGGGTSDFTVIRLSNQYINKKDRASDILANTGVRVGGNDFDKDLSLAAVMPEIGYQTTYGEKDLEVPLKPYHDLAEWSKVNFLYTTKIISQTRQILYQSHDKTRYERLLKVLEKEMGHTLLSATEETKIALTLQEEYQTPFDFIEEGLHIHVKRTQFEAAIQNRIEKISASATECLQKAQVKSEDIQLVILTGGSTEVPAVQTEFKRLFPNAAVADENKLSSVGLGLAYDSQNKFGK
ncbi:MAG: hsp70 family protein [Azospira oryzae]|jgi:hypothetical chaperone protein|nr:MAG: hsp70 family protein [Azospira oryzae]